MAETFKPPSNVGYDPFAAENAPRKIAPPPVAVRAPAPSVTKPVPKGTKKAKVVKKGGTTVKKGTTPKATGGAAPVAAPLGSATSILAKRPDLAWAINHPELGPILAQIDSLDPAEFAAKLYATNWWRTHGETERQAIAKAYTDPASYALDEQKMRAHVGELATQIGGNYDSGNIDQTVADMAIRFGWDDSQIVDELLRHSRRGNAPGRFNSLQSQIKAMSNDYMVQVSDDWAWNRAKEIISGDQSPDDVATQFKELAKSAFAGNQSLIEALDRGRTVRDWADPYIQTAAKELELSPDAMTLTDPKWNKFLYVQRDAQGNAVPMTLNDWTKEIRNNSIYGWDKTTGAREQAAGFAHEIAKQFGAVGS